MAPKRDPRRDQAYEIYKQHGSKIQNRQLAAMLDLPEKTIGGWKSKDKWDEKLNGVLQSNERSTPIEMGGTSPPGKGRRKAAEKDEQPTPKRTGRNKGGQPRNSNAVTHGFFQRYFPDDEETQALLNDVEELTAADMLWINIKTQFAAIIRAQKLMFVTDQDDMTKEVRRTKRMTGEDMEIEEDEWEIQFAWDKQAKQLAAQSRAMAELRSLIRDFLSLTGQDDKRRLELAQMEASLEKTRAEVEKLKGGNDDVATVVFVEDLDD